MGWELLNVVMVHILVLYCVRLSYMYVLRQILYMRHACSYQYFDVEEVEGRILDM